MRSLLLVLSLTLAASITAQERVTAITNATIITVTKGVIERGTVIIRGTKIAAVGANVAVPAGARVIDAEGKYIFPGIIDSHSHTAVEGSVNEVSQPNSGMVRGT